MSKQPQFNAELQTLKSKIKTSGSSPDPEIVRSESSRVEPVDTSEIERVLRELQSRVADVPEGVEDAIATHPLASVGAAFLLGIAVGRLMKRM